MDYYKISFTGDDKVWKEYFTFDYNFYYQNREISFSKGYKENKLDKLKVRVLSEKGEYVNNQSFFKKDIAPPIIQVDNIFLFRDDIVKNFKTKSFGDFHFIKIKIEGSFNNNYFLLCFKKIIDCVDWDKSVKKDFDFLSKLIIDKSKISKNTNGFFLTEWSEYDEYSSIVSEITKENISKLKNIDKFLIFEKV